MLRGTGDDAKEVDDEGPCIWSLFGRFAGRARLDEGDDGAMAC